MNGMILGDGTASLSSGVSAAMTVITAVMEAITGNPILLACFCMGLIGLAVSALRRMKH
ncbi:MAG: hypothetical protein NC347_15555 [Clostridium sp.]|nr:hypothetical protein [Clostridium sp.]